MPPTTASDRYKWIALSNTTLGVLMATVNSSILLIALPDIFRGIKIDPLAPGNTNYLLWMILSFLVVTAVLVVSLGRLGRQVPQVGHRVRAQALAVEQHPPQIGRASCRERVEKLVVGVLYNKV